MIILALDLGTHTGWALGAPGFKGVLAGTVLLATTAELKVNKTTRADRRCDFRVTIFSQWLREMIKKWDVHTLIFEDVRFTVSQAQAHLWGSFRGSLWSVYAENPGLKIDCVDTGKLKKFATGNGGADKEAMAAAVPKEFIEKHWDDNTIDAYHLLRWAQQAYGK